MTESETDIQSLILEALTYHPAVAWIRRYNSATIPTARGGKWRQIQCHRAAKGVKYKQLDLMGMLKGGRTLVIEVKKPGEKADDEQQQEINRVNADGGLAFWADSVESAFAQLNARLDALPALRRHCTR